MLFAQEGFTYRNFLMDALAIFSSSALSNNLIFDHPVTGDVRSGTITLANDAGFSY
jgi:hypothetical protein